MSNVPSHPQLTKDFTDFTQEIAKLDNIVDRTALTCRGDYNGCFETIMELRNEIQRFCLELRSWETPESLKFPLDVLAKTKRLGELFERIEDLNMGGRHELRGTHNPVFLPLSMSNDVLWNMLAFHARSNGEIVRGIKDQQKRLPEKARFSLDETIEKAEHSYGRNADDEILKPVTADIIIPASVWGHDQEELQMAGSARLACVEIPSLSAYLDCFSQQIAKIALSEDAVKDRVYQSRSQTSAREDPVSSEKFQNPLWLALVVCFFVWRLSGNSRPPAHRSVPAE